MRILVVGGGGREHALAWKLSREAEVIAAPGNPGMAEDVEVVPISPKKHLELVDLCKKREIDLVVVGPEDPLIEGLADVLRENGISVYGPGADGAGLEGSKAFSKQLMANAGVPTAKFQTFTDAKLAKEYAKARFDAGKSVAVKASGNALGKGVVVAASFEEANDAIHQMMVGKQFGIAGEKVVIEDKLEGPEFSVLTIVGDQNFVSLPIAQDHKRAYDGNKGPNTGGMGAFSPVSWVHDSLVRQVEETIIKPTLAALKDSGITYRGTLFSGIMMEEGRPHCLEFNVRMGDPETQVIVARLGNGFMNALAASANGEFIEGPEVLQNAVVSVVVASEHYPILSSKGSPITFLEYPVGVKFFHAGTTMIGDQLVTNGGRVINATAAAGTLRDARKLAYRAAAAVSFEAARFRTDIASEE